MKNLFKSYPHLSRFVLGVLLLAASLIGSGFINIPFVPVGTLLVIIVNWVMLRSEGRNFSFLGFDLTPRYLLLLPLGLLLGIASFLLSFYIGALVRNDHISASHIIDGSLLFKAFWAVLPTTVVQDFIIVGYCYVKLIELTNKRIATALFAVFFICMHDVWGGNVWNFVFYASTLLLGYLMFSTAFLRSGSIWLVIGLHWGNNFANSRLITFSRTTTSWLFIDGQSHNNLNTWQVIALFSINYRWYCCNRNNNINMASY
ncbi:CPBP family intramembrane glutamic endopeptidase [Mucilaginibacter calamicampi]|uniref:CPBP family intramembrane glutamic endopeptidase n=1 Tax=Mucilaginibacter calamicampi TaxID=1302352 RepID=A0ABW2YXZ8_9SPHI